VTLNLHGLAKLAWLLTHVPLLVGFRGAALSASGLLANYGGKAMNCSLTPTAQVVRDPLYHERAVSAPASIFSAVASTIFGAVATTGEVRRAHSKKFQTDDLTIGRTSRIIEPLSKRGHHINGLLMHSVTIGGINRNEELLQQHRVIQETTLTGSCIEHIRLDQGATNTRRSRVVSRGKHACCERLTRAETSVLESYSTGCARVARMWTSDQREQRTDGVLLFGCGHWPLYGCIFSFCNGGRMMFDRVRLLLFGLPVLLSMLAMGGIAGQETGADAQDDAPAAPAGAAGAAKTTESKPQLRGRLPAYFAAVVSQQQREEIYRIQARVQEQIDKMLQQIADLEKARDEEIDRVLSPEQLEEVKKKRMAAEQRRRERSSPGGEKPSSPSAS
jgi:hypothetical protein